MQAGFNQQQERIENYIFDTMDTHVVYLNNMIDSLDKFSGKTFTTYYSKIKNFVEYSVENGKEIIRTGKLSQEFVRKD